MQALHSDPDPTARYNKLVVGKYSWVPDDHPGGTATAALRLKDWPLCLDVECEPRPDTALRRLCGTVTSLEPGTGDLGFSPTGGHPSIAVPVRRIVALTGDRQRRHAVEVPFHEPYERDGCP